MRVKALLIALALAATAFAGCISTEDDTPPEGTSPTATAGTNRGIAQNAAIGWKSDARLGSVFGVETSQMDESDFGNVSLMDGTIGDGKAPAWAYAYYSPSTPGAFFFVAVAANGTILQTEEETEGDDDEPDAIAGWNLDSDRALGIAVEHDEDFTDIGPEDTIWMALAMETIGDLNGTDDEDANETEESATDDDMDEPLWVIVRLNEDGAFVGIVNARNGTYHDGGDFDMDFDIGDFDIFGPPPEKGTFEGTLTAAAATASHSFTVNDPRHPELVLALVFETPSPTATVHVTVTLPDGRMEELERSGTPATPGATTLRIETPMEGQYGLAVELTAGLVQQYKIDWCATGFEISIDFGGPLGNQDPCRHE